MFQRAHLFLADQIGESDCEDIDDGFLAQPVNALSSLAYTLFGIWLVIRAVRNRTHEMAIEIAGCRAVIVQTDRDYQIDVAALESAITSQSRAIVTISPNNPTGAVYSRESLTAVNRLCRDRGLYHISDEAYEYFVYRHTAFAVRSW